MVVATLVLGALIPLIKVDTDPENMLSAEEPVRLFHNQTKRQFDLSDIVVLANCRRLQPPPPVTLTHSGPARDQYRHLTTLRLTKLLMNQNLRLSLFTYYSPSDKDAHLWPNIHYKVNNNLSWEMGANIFFGDYPNTFSGQFQNNTNIYTGLRYSF
jgi:hypothetical protein